MFRLLSEFNICAVTGPVPGPNSTITLFFVKSICLTIFFANDSDDGIKLPV